MSALPTRAKDHLVEVLTESRDYAVVFIDAEGRIDGWTGSAPQLFGYAAEEVLGRDFALLFVPEDAALGMHRQEMDVAAVDRRSEDDRWHLRKDGSRFWGSGVLHLLESTEGGARRYCKVLRDRSDVRMRTEALENELEGLRADLRRREEFVAAVVHELRAPLSPISAATEVLAVSEDRVARERSVQALKRQLGVLTRHLEDLYDASRAALGDIRLQVETLVVNGLLRAVVDDAAAAARRQQVDLRLVVPERPVEIEADPQRLQQMVQNLVGNAIKYTPAGGHVIVSASVEGRDLMIRVEDNGAGIDPAVLPRMFELFTREDRPDRKAWPQGLGVGLALVKTLSRLHGGTVEGRSLGRDQGSVFALRLPLRQPPSRRPPPAG